MIFQIAQGILTTNGDHPRDSYHPMVGDHPNDILTPTGNTPNPPGHLENYPGRPDHLY